MKLAVVIATAGRRELVAQLLSHLCRQRSMPDEVILAVSDPAHLPSGSWPGLTVSSAFGSPGLTSQRNAALKTALGRFDVLTFMDDDFIPAFDYIEKIRHAFTDNPSWAVVMGHVIRDGVKTNGIDWADGLSNSFGGCREQPARKGR